MEANYKIDQTQSARAGSPFVAVQFNYHGLNLVETYVVNKDYLEPRPGARHNPFTDSDSIVAMFKPKRQNA